MSRARSAWWPPKVGDKLRHDTLHGNGSGGVSRVDALLHVLAVFDDMNGDKRVVAAEWFPTRQRWNYEIFTESAAQVGLIWPDGADKPETR